MFWSIKPLRLTSTGLVLVPLAVSTIAAVLVSLAIWASERIDGLSQAAISGLLIAAICLYAVILVVLGWSGIAEVSRLEKLGKTDALTGLANRHALIEDIARWSAGTDDVALALIDLDSFKSINDHYGHELGDQLIIACAEMLTKACGAEARCYRLGGDEFAAVFAGRVAGTILEGMCRTLLERLSAPVAVGERLVTVGASVGLANSTADERLPASEMLRRGDVAMYMSKRGGRMRCTWFNAAFDQRRERVREIEDDIRAGLAAGEFGLAYQPVVDADTRRIMAVEALLRWDRGERTPLSPNVFVPIAEDAGLINPLGLWVLRKAMCDALHWGEVALSVNISAAQLRNPEFPIKLGECLEETGFPAHRLELEVTETCLVLDPVVAERALDIVRSFGVRIALDDFGTGYASIGFLRQFRFEKLKLDRSLIEVAASDEASRAMMLSSIALARALRMAVVAEGVETTEQAELVRLAGCEQIQGWLYHRALPAETVAGLIRAQAAERGETASHSEGNTGTTDR